MSYCAGRIFTLYAEVSDSSHTSIAVMGENATSNPNADYDLTGHASESEAFMIAHNTAYNTVCNTVDQANTAEQQVQEYIHSDIINPVYMGVVPEVEHGA